jgi:hypothetical protein
MRIVPEKSYGLPGNLLDGPESIMIAVRSGENNDAKFHRNPHVHYMTKVEWMVYGDKRLFSGQGNSAANALFST